MPFGTNSDPMSRAQKGASAHRMLDDAFAQWVATAEREIAAITGAEVRTFGLRCLPPTAKWQPVLHQRHGSCDTEAVADGWKWLYEQLRGADHLRRGDGELGARRGVDAAALLAGFYFLSSLVPPSGEVSVPQGVFTYPGFRAIATTRYARG